MKKLLSLILILLLCLPVYASAAVEHEIASIWRQLDSLLTGRDDLRALYDLDAKLTQYGDAQPLESGEDLSDVNPVRLGEPELEPTEEPAQEPEPTPAETPIATEVPAPTSEPVATEQPHEEGPEPTEEPIQEDEPAIETNTLPVEKAISLPTDLKGLVVGSRGADVERLQNRLVELGYLDDTVDGRYGKNTRDAIRIIQDENMNGVADVYLQIVLRGLDPNGDEAAKLVTLSSGASGEAVTAFQEALKANKLLSEVSGVYDEATENAVLDHKKGLPYGQADVYTQMLVLSGSVGGVSPGSTDGPEAMEPTPEPEVTPEPIDSPEPEATPEPIETPAPESSEPPPIYIEDAGLEAEEVPVVSEISLPTLSPSQQPGGDDIPESEKRSLKLGDEGDDVKALQERLAELGYYSGPIDGVYGEDTAKAVQSFQLDGLILGVADTDTLDRLYE